MVHHLRPGEPLPFLPRHQRKPRIAFTSSGAGKYSITASSIVWTPLFLNAEPHSAGTISLASVLVRMPDLISSTDSSFPSRYFSIKSSSASAAASTSFSRYSSARSCNVFRNRLFFECQPFVFLIPVNRLHLDQVNYTGKVIFSANRELNRHRR